MNFCQSVIQSQFPCIAGFQNTWRVPVLANKVAKTKFYHERDCKYTTVYRVMLLLNFRNFNRNYCFTFTAWRVPVLENNKWIYQHKMRYQPSPSVQIHHTGCDHWITSCQDSNGTIYVLDSMNGKTLTTSVEIQMSLIYGKGKSVVPVKIPKVQQQQNS
jgi:hypothetical protein